MNEMSKRQIAYFHLKFKIENAYTIDSMTNLGLMRVEDISSKVLKDIYATEDTFSAVMECSKDGVLDVHYSIPCKKCKNENLILEDNYKDITVLRNIVKTGVKCTSCGTHLSQDPEKVDVRLSIPLRFLGSDDPNVENISFFKRLFRWFGLKKK